MSGADAHAHAFHDLAFRETDLAVVRARRGARILRVALWMATGSCAAFALLFAFSGDLFTAAVELVVMALAGALLIALARGRAAVAAHGAFALTFAFIIAFNLFEGIGPGAGHSLHVWLIALALVCFLVFPGQPWVNVGYAAVCLATFSILELGLVRVAPLLPVSRAAFAVANPLAVAMAAAVVVVCLAVFRADISAAEDRLNRANARLEDLLENMLPQSIAARLRNEGRTFAEAFGECTILFADIVGFSALAARTPPVELVRTLDTIFSRFDELVDRFGLEKIKTIGDAYMVAAGIPDARADHAAATVALALEMQRAIGATPGITVRIGINSGAVVAGVIGRKRFIYDLWGDAVNVAQRMEQSGIAGGIHITATTAALVRDAYELQPRGRIAIKGGGELETFLVIGPRRPAPGAATPD
ncbi:MAG: adenylate/guanylate cyclase domain-containing protein [Burkholderiales bacterium]|nr:adenylate/guanylate cyclase domain-containing protein [Burkholderiales bacterium]